MKRWILSFSLLLVLGCKSPEMVLDLVGTAGFYDRGFPSDLARTPDGRPDVSNFPMGNTPTVASWKQVALRESPGFHPMMPIYLRFTEDPPRDALVPPLPPEAYTVKEAPIQIVDVDAASSEYGTRFPLSWDFRDRRDAYRPNGLLQILPRGKVLKEATTYAAFVTRDVVNDPEYQAAITPNPVLEALLAGRDPRTVEAAITPEMALNARNVFAPLAEFLAREGLSPTDVLAATVWTTGSLSAPLDRLIRKISRWDAPVPSFPLVHLEERPHFYVLHGTWTAPGFQKGNFPYVTPLDDGRIRYTADGSPIVQYQREADFVLTIPKKTMPEKGFPLLVYNHGTDGRADQVLTRGVTTENGPTEEGNPAELAAREGWATSGMAGHMGAEHQDQKPFLDAFGDLLPGLSLNIAAYNFLNPQAMRDNFFQMVAERVLFRKLANRLEIDPALCPETRTDGRPIVFDSDLQVVMGQSLGSMTAGAMAASSPHGYQGQVGTGAGSYGLELVFHLAMLKNQAPIGGLLSPLFFFTGKDDITGDPFHPVWALSKVAIGDADHAVSASRWTRSPETAASPAPHTLMVAGFFDDWVTTASQVPLFRALETDMAGPDLDGIPESHRLLPKLELAGATSRKTVVGNLDGRTSALLRYREDGILSGHHVFFQHAHPKMAFRKFLHAIEGGIPPEISAP